MSAINSSRLTATPSTTRATTATPARSLTPTPFATSSTLAPVTNLTQQTTSQINMGGTSSISSSASAPGPVPNQEIITTQGTEGDDVLQANVSTTQAATPPRGYHGIYGKGGTDTLVFPKRLADYQVSIPELTADPITGTLSRSDEITITDRNTSSMTASQPPRTIRGIERFQFSDVTLDKAALIDPLQELKYYKQLWAREGSDNYIIRLSRNSQGMQSTTVLNGVTHITPESSSGMAVVEVQNGQVVSASLNQLVGHAGVVQGTSPDQTVDPQLAKFTVDSLFDLIERSIAEGKTVKVQYSPEGLPRGIYIGNVARINYFADLLSTIVPATEGDDKVKITVKPSSYLFSPNIIGSNDPNYINTAYRAGAGQDTAILPGKLSDYYIRQVFNDDSTVAIRPYKGQPITAKDFETFQFDDVTLTKAQLLDPAQTLDYHRQQWQNQGINSYSMYLSKDSSGTGQNRTMVQSNVVNGQVKEAVAYGPNTTTNSQPDAELAQLTIDKLFDLAKAAANRGEKVDVYYDSRSIPTQFFIGNTSYMISIPSLDSTMTLTPPSAPIPIPQPVTTTTPSTRPERPTNTTETIRLDQQTLIRLLVALVQLLQTMKART
ncbi:DUF6174 domain-containing protein [Thiofilum flexile]|uniref:DUF6174 domain-containing protein n=1 Tax=Thiofilum flexile TaxID=125627 RepID=UPI000378BE59|nr:DUF6174 domain-containing protein [Thiofilum flexile]